MRTSILRKVDIGIIALCRLSGAAAGFALGPVLYSILTREEFGYFSVVFAIFLFAQSFDVGIGANMQTALPRVIQCGEALGYNAREYTRASLRALLIPVAVIPIIFGAWYNLDLKAITASSAGGLALLCGLSHRVLVSIGRFSESLVLQTISSVATSIAVVLAGVCGASGAMCAFVAISMSLVGNAIGWIRASEYLGRTPHRTVPLVMKVLGDSSKYALLQPLAHGTSNIPLLVAGGVCGLAETADLALWMKIFGLVGSVLAILQPRFWVAIAAEWVRHDLSKIWVLFRTNLKICLGCIAINALVLAVVLTFPNKDIPGDIADRISKIPAGLSVACFAWSSALLAGSVVSTALNALAFPASQIIGGALYISVATACVYFSGSGLGVIGIPICFGISYIVLGLLPTSIDLYYRLLYVRPDAA